MNSTICGLFFEICDNGFMNTINIKIILASIRNNRFGDKPAKWIMERAQKLEGASVELLDLRDYQLPMFAEGVSPSHVVGDYEKPEVNRWAKKIAEADAFVIVTPEYNHGYPSALKNNIDYLYKEWNKKAIAFVSYGTTGGGRVIQQLRSVATELQMAPIRNSVHIFFPWNLLDEKGELKPGAFDVNEKSAENMFNQLLWWANALKSARETGKQI